MIFLIPIITKYVSLVLYLWAYFKKELKLIKSISSLMNQDFFLSILSKHVEHNK